MKHTVWTLLAAAALLGCAPVYWEEDVENHAVIVDREPPAPRDETVVDVEPPGSDWVWAPGYWYWSGLEWRWVSGRWALPPAPGVVWVRSGWVLVGGRYRYVPGRWARPGRVPQYRYVHPARRYRPTYRRR